MRSTREQVRTTKDISISRGQLVWPFYVELLTVFSRFSVTCYDSKNPEADYNVDKVCHLLSPRYLESPL